MTKTSSLALLAAMGLACGAVSAQAADLGGNCCADLEERVAELEATTARKGNRKVSLEVSGWVHQGIMWFDGVSGTTANAGSATVSESNTYVGINRPEANSRFRFVGKAAINAKMNAGYLMEIQVNTANADAVTGANDDDPVNTLQVRHSAWWLEHKDIGKVWVGQTSQSTDGIMEIQLSNTGHMANSNTTAGGTFRTVFHVGGNAFAGPQLRNFMGGDSTDSAQIGEGNRRNLVKYESPAIAGFIVSASAGEDDFWDVALRYAGEFSGFKLAFGIGYEQTTDGPVSAGSGSERNCVSGVGVAARDVSCQQLGLSGSIMHVPTGLFVNGYYGRRQDDNAALTVATANLNDTSTRWGVMGGIEKNWFGFGKTTLFGEYHEWEVGQTAALIGGAGTAALNLDLSMRMWGVGLNQSIDAAAMDLYIQYRNYDDMQSVTNGVVVNGALVRGVTNYDSIQQIMAGGIIKF